MTTNREIFKKALEQTDDATINLLHSVLMAIHQTPIKTKPPISDSYSNPLKNTITYENDIISPIEENWEME